MVSQTGEGHAPGGDESKEGERGEGGKEGVKKKEYLKGTGTIGEFTQRGYFQAAPRVACSESQWPLFKGCP